MTSSTINVKKSGWIFSPGLDFFCFWLPSLIAYSVYFKFSETDLGFLAQAEFLFVVYIVNATHLLATVSPVALRTAFNHFSKVYLIFCFFVSIAFFALYFLNRNLFFQTIAVFTIWHLIRQQYGWLILSRRFFGENNTGFYKDQILFWTPIITSLIWWLSTDSEQPKTYFNSNDLFFVQHLIPSFLPQILRYLFVLAIVLTTLDVLLSYIYRKNVNWSKYSIIFSTNLWFFLLIFINSRTYFFAVLAYIHGFTYIFHVYRDSFHNFKRLGKTQIELSLYCIAIVLLGILWHSYERWSYQYARTAINTSWIEVIAWYPLMLHYYFDATMWKKSKYFEAPLVANLAKN